MSNFFSSKYKKKNEATQHRIYNECKEFAATGCGNIDLAGF